MLRDVLSKEKRPLLLSFSCVYPFLLLIGFVFSSGIPFIICGFLLFLFHINLCIQMTFDGFIRFSRYRLSRKHPILDKLISFVFIGLSFVGFSPIALIIKSYSLLVSNDEHKIDRSPFYNAPYIVPFVQSLILLTAILVITFGS